VDFIREHDFGPGITISDESDLLLDTGGGLKKASWYFTGNDPFILHNVDVLSNINLTEMVKTHILSGALATLAVSDRVSSRYFLFDNGMNLAGWENTTSREVILSKTPVQPPVRYAFSGIHVINPEIFKFIKEEGRFSLVDVYVRLAHNHIIKGYCHSPDHWIDMGRPKDLERAEEMIRKGFKGDSTP
jgi:NDP-sugar pyrophosphorylase family protein